MDRQKTFVSIISVAALGLAACGQDNPPAS